MLPTEELTAKKFTHAYNYGYKAFSPRLSVAVLIPRFTLGGTFFSITSTKTQYKSQSHKYGCDEISFMSFIPGCCWFFVLFNV